MHKIYIKHCQRYIKHCLKQNVHKTFIWRQANHMNVLCMFDLGRVPCIITEIPLFHNGLSFEMECLRIINFSIFFFFFFNFYKKNEHWLRKSSALFLKKWYGLSMFIMIKIPANTFLEVSDVTNQDKCQCRSTFYQGSKITKAVI